MFHSPFFAAGYFPAPYFPKPVITGGNDYFPTPYFGAENAPGAFWVIGGGPPPPIIIGDYYPTPYFGKRNAPGNFWVIGSGAPAPTPSRDGGGGGWDVVKTNAAHRREAVRLARIAEEDELLLNVVKLFMQGIQ